MTLVDVPRLEDDLDFFRFIGSDHAGVWPHAISCMLLNIEKFANVKYLFGAVVLILKAAFIA